MNLSTGIIGLPNVGKSTLFNAITNSQVEAANYPFATIEPNIGIVNLADKRLDKLSEIVKPEKTIYSLVKFVDIAGLVKGASNGEGLGNKFLQNIRDVDAIIHVVRCFEDPNITHVNNKVNPIDDVEIINLELILSDLEIVNNRINKIKKSVTANKDKTLTSEYDVLNKILKCLEENKLAIEANLNKEEIAIIKNFNLITIKPYMFVANVDELSINDQSNNKYFQQLKEYADKKNIKIIPISAKIESEISTMNKDDQVVFLKELGIDESGLNKVIRNAFELLNLCTFFTVGKKEVRSWIFKKNSLAPECAGIIHSDFERGFIKVEIIKYDDFIHFKSEQAVKDAGKLNVEGKNYQMQDGDICNFKFNV